MKWIDYRERLKIGFSDEKKVDYVITNLLTFVRADMEKVNVNEFLGFVFETGTAVADARCLSEYYQYDVDRAEAIWDILVKYQNSFKEFISYYVALMNIWSDKNRKEGYKVFLTQMLENIRLQYELISDTDGYFIFPRGAKELDDALVSQPLEWLKNYPKSHKTYCTALKQYADGVYIRDVADNLRKALEAFLQEFLNNDKNLETNKNEICKYLGSQDVDAGISGLFQPLINAYKNINDRIAKHNDKVDKKLLEFLLYQTGVLIRMVLVVKQAETEEPSHAD